jgi:hypothetical protein
VHVRRTLSTLIVMALLAAACGRSDETTGATPTTPGGTSSDGTGPATTGGWPETTIAGEGGLDAGAFGDLGQVCSPGEAQPIDGEVGIDGTTISVAVFSDRGFAGRPGLTRELHDIGEAVAAWCNGHGGVRGYEIRANLRDAALTNYAPLVVEACDDDFFIVGGGAALDAAGVAEQLGCGLPSIPAYVVSAEATGADLTVQAVPNPPYTITSGDLQWIAEQHPDAIDKVGVFSADFPATLTAANRVREAAEQLGFEVVSSQLYNPMGESTYAPFVQAFSSAGVEGIIYAGEPEALAALLRAMQTQEYAPVWIRADANIYDQNLVTVAGSALDVTSLYINDFFVPFERAVENPATQQYLDLLDQYGPGDARVALLGMQGLTAWMLFLRSLGECIDAGTVTRDCVYEAAAVADGWTGGGLHVPTDPGSLASPECFALVQATGEGFRFPDVTGFGASDHAGFFACDPEFVLELRGDYGQGLSCPSGVDDPLPSECPG